MLPTARESIFNRAKRELCLLLWHGNTINTKRADFLRIVNKGIDINIIICSDSKEVLKMLRMRSTYPRGMEQEDFTKYSADIGGFCILHRKTPQKLLNGLFLTELMFRT